MTDTITLPITHDPDDGEPQPVGQLQRLLQAEGLLGLFARACCAVFACPAVASNQQAEQER